MDMVSMIKDFNKRLGGSLDAETRMMDISSEAGELAKEVIKSTSYGEKRFQKTNGVENELGDLLYSVISFALENGIDPKGAVEKVILKYENRLNMKGNMGS